MPRIATTQTTKKWRYKCPECGHSHWRVHDGTFGCRSCGETVGALVDDKTGETIPREDFEFVGPHADQKGQFGEPPTEGDD